MRHPATVAILHSVPASKNGVASEVNDAAREMGAAFGLAIAGTLLATGFSNTSATRSVRCRNPPAAKPARHSREP